MGLRSDPTYRQRRFGAELRRMRERARLSSTDAAALLGMRQPQLSSIEAGKTNVSAERVWRLAQEEGVSTQTFVEALIDLGQRSGRGWWSEYRGVLSAAHLDLAELEDDSRRVVTYEPMFVPGIFQTPDYADVIHHRGYRRMAPEERAAAVRFRVRRGARLTGEQPPRIHAVIHEAALSASLGEPKVMRDQLLHLIELSRLPYVTIQVLPFDGPIAFGTGFVLIEPRVRELGTVVVSHIEKSLYLDDAEALAKYRDWFATLSGAALLPVDPEAPAEARAVKDSLGLLQRILYTLL
ncbi:helix-turn-helix domain-containing protein [Streptomyces sp. HD]|uniref:helix-turn-helix domain-containing protein n=1 Tax=Streptomyces sp. HD TaxID=3020892 RepID=UPI00232FD0F4|nr:helix-turn-helix transcriptional regulator [Streptomyces sp. HD]MDC0772860.1 helix-turn-helix transcriptional regulator [Streptomyces sp. HD]